MAAPDYVPAPALDDPRVYQSPPWRGDAWTADRPGDLDGPRPTGAMLGDPGPDAGYALRLARAFHDRLVVGPADERPRLSPGVKGFGGGVAVGVALPHAHEGDPTTGPRGQPRVLVA